MTSTPPLLPELAALTSDDSMLTRRFGKEVINYYAGSRLNRYSFLRSDVAFLNKAATSSSARFVALTDLNPLVVEKRKLALLTYDDVKPLIEEPFKLADTQRTKNYDSTAGPSALIVFLGTVDGEIDDGRGGGVLVGQLQDLIHAIHREADQSLYNLVFLLLSTMTLGPR